MLLRNMIFCFAVLWILEIAFTICGVIWTYKNYISCSISNTTKSVIIGNKKDLSFNVKIAAKVKTNVYRRLRNKRAHVHFQNGQKIGTPGMKFFDLYMSSQAQTCGQKISYQASQIFDHFQI